jgi:hypothetical protein
MSDIGGERSMSHTQHSIRNIIFKDVAASAFSKTKVSERL